MVDVSRQIKVTATGEAVRNGKIPLGVLTRIFTGLQDTVNLMGRFHVNKGQVTERGPLPRRVREECNLHLAVTSEGSFIATIELPEKSQLAFSNGFSSDLGAQSLETLGALLHGVGNEDDHAIRQLLPDGLVRHRALRFLRDLAPQTGDQYRLDISVGKSKPVVLDHRSRVKLTRLLEEPKTERHRRLLGRVVELQIEPSPWFHIHHMERRIKCHFGPQVEPVLIQAVGQLVEIEGRAQIDAHGRLLSFAEVNDVEIVSLDSIRFEVVVGHDLSFALRQPLVAEVAYEDGSFLLENAALSILAYGATRTEAIAEFARDFEVLWQEYVEVSEDELTLDARELRQQLQDMVTEVLQQ